MPVGAHPHAALRHTAHSKHATLTFRGIKNLDAAVEWALRHGLSQASQFVLAGYIEYLYAPPPRSAPRPQHHDSILDSIRVGCRHLLTLATRARACLGSGSAGGLATFLHAAG